MTIIGARKVAPFAGAWIEIHQVSLVSIDPDVAPFAGAWIEISYRGIPYILVKSHPSRVRGLKFWFTLVPFGFA